MPRDVNGYTVRCKVDQREAKWLGATPISYTVQVKQGGRWKHAGSVWRDHGWAGCVEDTPDGDRLWSLHGYDCEETMRDVLWRLIPEAERHGLISRPALCVHCEMRLGLDCGEAEPDYDARHCSVGCFEAMQARQPQGGQDD